MNSESADTHGAQQEPGNLVISSIENCRDLGGYPTPFGFTQPHRFLRSGNTGGVSSADSQLLRSWGLSRVLDLRGASETAEHPDAFAHTWGVRYRDIPLHNTNLHDPRLAPQESDDSMDDFLTNGYLMMLGNRPGVRKIFKFFSHAKPHQCVLYHCAAGMDRTGVVSMLLLGLVGADRDTIRADYGYSFGSRGAVNQLVFGQPTFPAARASKKALVSENGQRNQPDPLRDLDTGTVESLDTLCKLMGNVYDRLLDAYGSTEKYLEACGCKRRELDRVKAHLLEP